MVAYIASTQTPRSGFTIQEEVGIEEVAVNPIQELDLLISDFGGKSTPPYQYPSQTTPPPPQPQPPPPQQPPRTEDLDAIMAVETFEIDAGDLITIPLHGHPTHVYDQEIQPAPIPAQQAVAPPSSSQKDSLESLLESFEESVRNLSEKPHAPPPEKEAQSRPASIKTAPSQGGYTNEAIDSFLDSLEKEKSSKKPSAPPSKPASHAPKASISNETESLDSFLDSLEGVAKQQPPPHGLSFLFSSFSYLLYYRQSSASSSVHTTYTCLWGGSFVWCILRRMLSTHSRQSLSGIRTTLAYLPANWAIS